MHTLLSVFGCPYYAFPALSDKYIHVLLEFPSVALILMYFTMNS